jgi:iron(III) transport system ATP-binding protein
MAVLDDGVIQQVGSPMSLYDEPANRFVASFLGTANLVEGTLEGMDGEMHFRTGDDIRIPVSDMSLQPGDGFVALFRPQSLAIRAADAPAPENTARLDGKVAHREFLGGLIRYSVNVGEHTLLVDDAHQSGRKTFDLEEPVSLYLDRGQVRILPG